MYRLLHYYKPYNIHIIVSDSSHLHCPFAIDQFENVVYRHFPDTYFFVKIKEIIPLIQTPYIVYVAEDDFTTLEGISQCVQFLESHPDYTSAQGHYLTFEPNRNNVKFTPRYIRNLNSQITGETARERLLSKGSLYGSLLYAVVRTEAFKKTYEVCFDPANKILFNNLFLAETLFNYSMLIQGKYATIPVFLYLNLTSYHPFR